MKPSVDQVSHPISSPSQLTFSGPESHERTNERTDLEVTCETTSPSASVTRTSQGRDVDEFSKGRTQYWPGHPPEVKRAMRRMFNLCRLNAPTPRNGVDPAAYADQLTSLADARAALCIASGIDLDHIDAASGHDLSGLAAVREALA